MRFDIYGYDKPNERIQSKDTIVHAPKLQKLITDLERCKIAGFESCHVVEIYHKDKFLGSVSRTFFKGKDFDSTK